MSPEEERRRAFLVRALMAGALAVAAPLGGNPMAMGRIPRQLPPGRSIFELRGSVFVNDRPATLETVIHPGDRIRTGADSHLIFVVGQDAFILRDNSRLQLQGLANGLIRGLRLLSGKLLSVMGRREGQDELNLHTSTAYIGIRGTGIYVESAPELSYVCTCYGHTELTSVSDPAQREAIRSRHHDAPRYILAPGTDDSGSLIQPAPFKNHTDEELMLIEALIGREPPFALTGSGYSAPRRDY